MPLLAPSGLFTESGCSMGQLCSSISLKQEFRPICSIVAVTMALESLEPGPTLRDEEEGGGRGRWK